MKPIFSRNIDINKTAFVNWRTSKNEDIQNMLVLAEGFLTSSIELAKVALASNKDKKADIMIFPILTNANHGIELYLKSLVWTLNKLLKSENKIEEMNHDIKKILETAQKKIEQYKDQESLDFFNHQIEELQSYINELFTIIKASPKNAKMDFSRYPFDHKYLNHFYVDELGNVEIDLENLISRFEKILETLDERISYFYYQELNQDW
ncbi:hypothetical protein [Cognataquiflexum rubidum]|uniref:hypothetical protein n=1 Tax=Cognataquiflexum rubidum TaxID=2922273 RepID=UPI001F14196F|nr:hypothetical protein [Cognataquiflexum rubidum]MCH6233945.1 hypothetical protein [Cognataquiflexum rubidum]